MLCRSEETENTEKKFIEVKRLVLLSKHEVMCFFLSVDCPLGKGLEIPELMQRQLDIANNQLDY